MTDNRRRRSAVRAVMFFAKDPETCGRWWAEQLAPGREVHVEAGGFCWFDLDGVEVGFHPADEERNPVGGSPVVYWSVTDFDTQRRQLLEAGCQPHRGPLDVEPGRRISQLVDPFGNIFGIDGLRQQERPAEGKASAWVVGSVTETSHATGSARDPNRTRPTMTEQAGPDLDTLRPHPARVYDYLLGGKNNFAADRALAEKMLQGTPSLRIAARENRAFLGRAVQYLAGEAGVRQFLDIGTGLPTADNVHEVAQRIAPESRVVYADNDPLVLAQARPLLASAPEGRTAYIHADLRDPAQILAAPQVRDVLDFGQPVALILVAVLHFLPDEDKPAEVVATLLDALPSGSYLIASHTALDHAPAPVAAMERAAQAGGIRTQQRDSGDFARFAFPGLDLVPPGVVLVSEWRPRGSAVPPDPAQVNIYCGVARKP